MTTFGEVNWTDDVFGGEGKKDHQQQGPVP